CLLVCCEFSAAYATRNLWESAPGWATPDRPVLRVETSTAPPLPARPDPDWQSQRSASASPPAGGPRHPAVPPPAPGPADCAAGPGPDTPAPLVAHGTSAHG